MHRGKKEATHLQEPPPGVMPNSTCGGAQPGFLIGHLELGTKSSAALGRTVPDHIATHTRTHTVIEIGENFE